MGTESSLDQMLPGGCDAGVEQGDWWGRPCPPPPPPAAAPAVVTYSSSRSDTHTNTTSSSSSSLGNNLAYFASRKHIFCLGKYSVEFPIGANIWEHLEEEWRNVCRPV